MPENTNAQTPATENQIEITRPKVGRSFNLLTGNIEGSMNAGHERLICWQEVMANQKIAVTGARLLIQTLTPKTPAFQKLKACIKVIKVPYVRVWKNYEEFAAQKGGASEDKPQVMPNLTGKKFPVVVNEEEQKAVSFQETTAWRDSFTSCIIPRVGAGAVVDSSLNPYPLYNKAPNVQALVLRAHVAAYNDILRNKEYDTERVEYYNMDTVSTEEWDSYITSDEELDYYFVRAKKDNSYYSNYRAELQGFGSELPESGSEDFTANEALINFAEWQHQTAEAMAQASNAQKNAWDVMQELRGGEKLTQGRVELLARKTFPLSYSAVTQNAYNNNPDIEENFRLLGKQGAYSFTDIDLAWLNGLKIEEDGVILVYMSVTADTIYESAVDRQLLNINWKDRYRPDLAKEKNDVLYNVETGTPYALNAQDEEAYNPIGFKRKYSELFKLPNCINGDLMNRGYWQTKPDSIYEIDNTLIETNHTFQFNEFAAKKAQMGTEEPVLKKHWKDYSDLMLNKNLAIPQKTASNGNNEVLIYGQNQIFYCGETYCITDMPVDEEIKSNYVKWGEY